MKKIWKKIFLLRLLSFCINFVFSLLAFQFLFITCIIRFCFHNTKRKVWDDKHDKVIEFVGYFYFLKVEKFYLYLLVDLDIGV